MNALEVLNGRIAQAFPGTKIAQDPANEEEHRRFVQENHWWFLNIECGEKEVGVEWKETEGFNIAVPGPDSALNIPFHTAGDCVCKDVEIAFQFIANYLRS